MSLIKLNQPVCAVEYGNTGYGECFLDPKKIVGAFQVTADFVIGPAQLADLQGYLEEKVLADIGLRIFPYHKFVGITDNTEDIQIETTDYGNKIPTRDGDYDLTFRFTEGGVTTYQEMQKNRGAGKYFIFYDQDNNLFGYKTKEGLRGIPTLFITQPWRFATGSTSAQYLLRFIFAPVYINYGNLAYLKATDFNFFDIRGLQDVTLELVNLASNVATVIARTTVSAANMYLAYSTNLQETGAWSAKDEEGNDVAITGVTAVANAQGDQGGFAVTFSTVPFNAADKVYLRWAVPRIMSATPILVSGFDVSVPLEIEAPAS
jgi:hypothetical protein